MRERYFIDAGLWLVDDGEGENGLKYFLVQLFLLLNDIDR